MIQSVTEKLDKLAHDALLSKHFHDGQNQIGRRGAFGQFSLQLKTHHLGNEHRNRLPQHRGLRFYAADAPTQHTQSIHHGGVRIRTHNGVGIGGRVVICEAIKDYTCQILDVDLMDDTCSRRHDLEITKCLLTPA